MVSGKGFAARQPQPVKMELGCRRIAALVTLAASMDGTDGFNMECCQECFGEPTWEHYPVSTLHTKEPTHLAELTLTIAGNGLETAETAGEWTHVHLTQTQ